MNERNDSKHACGDELGSASVNTDSMPKQSDSVDKEITMWNTENRIRQIWKGKNNKVWAVYFDNNSDNAIAWLMESDRTGEPHYTSIELMHGSGWEKISSEKLYNIRAYRDGEMYYTTVTTDLMVTRYESLNAFDMLRVLVNEKREQLRLEKVPDFIFEDLEKRSKESL